MNRRYRKTIIAGNWKMNMTPSEAKALIADIRAKVNKAKWCDVVICVPFTDLPAAIKACKGGKISVGAQNVHFEDHGAFTGEISCSMLKDLGVKFVIVGHSERRQYFCESDEIVNKKLLAVLAAGMRPILCVGETLEQRERNVTSEHIKMQIKIALNGVTPEQMRKIVVAYEPIWAIGTGKTATSEQAAEVCTTIRETIRGLYGARVARAVTIQYGGSMKPSNAAELLAQNDVDGGLIGGASLKADDFAAIINAANQ